MNFAIITTVANVEKRTRSVWLGGVGKDAVFKSVSLGWFVRFHDSQEALFCGFEEPDIKVGDEYKITFEKRTNNAQPR